MGSNIVQSGDTREILVVEDHEATAEMVTMVLEDQGYKVTWVNTAKAAIEHFAKLSPDNHDRCPDLILLDLTLPDMNAVDLVNHVIETHRSTPPVIVVSAQPVPSVKQAAQAIGAVDVVLKPYLIETLLESIDHALA